MMWKQKKNSKFTSTGRSCQNTACLFLFNSLPLTITQTLLKRDSWQFHKMILSDKQIGVNEK